MLHHKDALEPKFDALKMLCETAIKFGVRQEENKDEEDKEENPPILDTIQSDTKELGSTAEAALVRPPIHGGNSIWSVEDQAKPLRKRKIICSQHEHNEIISTHDSAVNGMQTRFQRRNNLMRTNEEGIKSNTPIFRARRRGRGRRSAAGGGEQRVSWHGRGRAPMKESSRCSRYNGRGWRCSRRTYVGYCLCEYHLEKAKTKISTNSNGHMRENRKCDIKQ